jgi:hypothetical protein
MPWEVPDFFYCINNLTAFISLTTALYLLH